ncbi:MAG TPA: TIGR03621 family F420-dependent LLM class oxidoreductase [Thermomicrobiales bacterium]|nr:TIGR03621 family F420-dependent LLM class oxidoreductase [Thermomicrobiales bacterium]
MATHRPFRFGVQGRSASSKREWTEKAIKVEALGFSTLMVPDHFVRCLAPAPALAAAAMVTVDLRLGGLVWDNDFRHPAVLAKDAATIDVLSDGRLEFGIGAGWLKDEYDQTGIPFDPPSVRIERMEEAVRLIKKLFTEDPITFKGDYYGVEGLTLPPKPVQKPHPPILIGGGGRKLLSVAAREADIVGFTTRARADGTKVTEDMTIEGMEQKLAWVREAAGVRFEHLELNAIITSIAQSNNRQAAAENLAGTLGLTSEQVIESPLTLVGSTAQMVDDLQARRERFGISYIAIFEDHLDILAPVVARLAGT